MKSKKQHRRALVIPPSIWDALDEEAEKQFISKSELVRKILRNHINKRSQGSTYDPKSDSVR